MATDRGRYVWYDLLTDDVDKAVAFYTTLFGWTTDATHDASDSGYRIFKANGKGVGGAMNNPSPKPPHWIGYISTPDVEASCEHVVARGGRVPGKPREIPNVGRFAYVGDRQGVVFSVFKDANPSPAAPPTGPGSFTWNELIVPDPLKALEDYGAWFGWTSRSEMTLPSGTKYYLYGIEGEPGQLGGMYAPAAGTPPHFLFYVWVTDVKGTLDRVGPLGGKVLWGPITIPDQGTTAAFLDPSGAMIAVYAIATAAR